MAILKTWKVRLLRLRSRDSVHYWLRPCDLLKDFDVVAGVPVAVIIEAAGFLEHAMQFNAARAHVIDVGLR